MPDLPDISQNVDDPLPEVDPNSQLVPYRMSRTADGGQPVVTTGYGQRGRTQITPPDAGAPGMPSTDQIYQAAFSKLPVREAAQAVEAATRYQAQRGYQKDLQNGLNAAQAFAKWGPLLFKQATGIPEAIDRSVPTPITPQQLIQNRIRQQSEQRLADAQKFRETQVSPDVAARIADAQAARAAKPVKELSETDKEALKDSYTELNELRKQSLTLQPPERSKKQEDKDKWFENQQKMLDARKRISKIGGTTPTNPAQPVNTQGGVPFKEGTTVRNKKDGKLYKISNGQPVLVKE